MAVSGSNKERAKSYLEKANWDLQVALTNFFDEPIQDDNNVPDAADNTTLPIEDLVAGVIESAQKNGAEIVDSSSGQSPNPSGLSDPTQNTDPITLRLWRKGFTIDENELRLYEEPGNRKFMEYINKGQVPPELLQKGKIVEVLMEDHRDEDFKPKPTPEPTKAPFSGAGHSLGGNDATSNVPVPQALSAAENKANEKLAAEKLNVDKSKPTTPVRIRLADGTKLTGRFNLSHTIDDIRTFITNARPQYAALEFSLLTTRPIKELTDSEQTIEEAELSNSTIMQRLN